MIAADLKLAFAKLPVLVALVLETDVDVSSTNAKLSIENNYYKPEVINSEKSFIRAKDMRHPIVEKINREVEYITNDVTLGEKRLNQALMVQNPKEDGILLFGTNACGKSTFMKAIGLNLIMDIHARIPKYAMAWQRKPWLPSQK